MGKKSKERELSSTHLRTLKKDSGKLQTADKYLKNEREKLSKEKDLLKKNYEKK